MSHQRIIESAARLLRERGIESASVADVMQDAGLTHGGFYRHFKTKEALVAAGIVAAFNQMTTALEKRFDKFEPEAAVEDYRTDYLSRIHVEKPGIGCPIAALAGDVARASEAHKLAFGAGVSRIVAMFAKGLRGSAQARRASALRQLSMLVGAVMIARASDPETARAVLAACRQAQKSS